MAGVRQFDEEAVLDKALALFWQKGLGATTMLDLAQATGVQRGSLYHAYGSKEALFMQVFTRYHARTLADARAALAAPDLEAGLKAYFDQMIASLTTGSPTRGCLNTKTAVDDAVANDMVRDAIRKVLDGLEALLRERLSAPDARARLSVPPADAARLVVGLGRGLVVLERVYGEPARLRKTAAALIKALLPH